MQKKKQIEEAQTIENAIEVQSSTEAIAKAVQTI